MSMWLGGWVRVVATVLAATTVCGWPVVADAATIDLVSVDSAFSNAVGGTFVTFSHDPPDALGGAGTSEVRWGTQINGMGQSGLGFDPVTPPPQTLLPTGTPFNLGALTHFNITIGLDTASTAVDLSVTLNTDNPALLPPPTFTFTLNIEETPNNPALNPGGVCPYGIFNGACSDRISWANPVSQQVFDIGGTLYTLKLIGFGPSPNPLDSQTQFISREFNNSSTLLWAEVDVAPVPEPGSLLLLGSGLIGLGLALRRRLALRRTARI